MKLLFAAFLIHHYIYFATDRERIHEKAFLETAAIEGAQIRYTWRSLEPEKDVYDFAAMREDLAFLTSHGKKLFIQLQDASFVPTIKNVPRYLQDSGVVRTEEGWVAKRWNPDVQARFHKLMAALGKEFDGRIEGINLPETAIGPVESPEAYRDAIIENMRALKRAFPKSTTMQYANFMPGEWLPGEDKGYLKAVYRAAKESKIGVGGPDLLPLRKPQLNHAYPLIREAAGMVPTGIAVQDGNLQQGVTVPDLYKFAAENLKVNYIFWGTQEPFYTRDVIPFLSAPR